MIAPWALFSVFTTAVDKVAGWTFEKVIQGIYEWIANGLVLLLQRVWQGMDTLTTPKVTDGWFANGLVGQLTALAGAVTLLMVFSAAAHAALAGRPELLGDVARHGLLSIVSTVLLVTVLDAALVATDEAAGFVWGLARPDLATMTETLATVARQSQESGVTFVMPAMLVLTIIAVCMLIFVFLLRGALIYLVAAFAPLVFAGAISPSFRQSRAKLVQVLTGLVLAKLAIAVALTVAAKVIVSAGAPGQDPGQQLFTVFQGAVCFMLAAVAPWLLYRLIPIAEHAGQMHGLGSTMFRGAMTATQVAMMGSSAARSLAARPIPGGSTATRQTSSGTGGAPSGGGPGSGLGGQEAGTGGGGLAARAIPQSVGAGVS